MRGRNVLVVAVCLLVAGGVLAQAKMSSKAAKPVIWQSGDMKWTDLDANAAPGVKIADLWGDHTKGAYGAITKFPAGFSAPLHTHTNTMRIVVISGTFIHTPEGKLESRLGPGSYLLQPGGNYRHSTACDKASECVFFIESSGKFDIKPVEEKK